MIIGLVNTLRDTADYTKQRPGPHTDFYEITAEEYERITSISNYRGKLNTEYEKVMPLEIRYGYGFYGADVIKQNGKYYYTLDFGNKCE